MPVRARLPCREDPGIGQPPGLPSGGGGLYSTAGDYLRFAQMVLNGGEFNGVRLVAPSTIELMRSNHLSDEVKNAREIRHRPLSDAAGTWLWL